MLDLWRFNPSPGLNVFQTPQYLLADGTRALFQSLTWVERLSDSATATLKAGDEVFQSLTWVERLSDLTGELLAR